MNEPWEAPFSPASGCSHCTELAESRHTVVWGRGPLDASVMVVAEAPGYNEDRRGLPLVGQSGRFAEQLLQQCGLDPSSIRFSNIIMCHPPGNRDPSTQEIANCEPWLIQHVRQVNPRGIILFGAFAARWRFDRATVRDTQGLMVRDDCDSCGRLAYEHATLPGRLALDGLWKPDTMGYCKTGEYVRRRLYVSTYHPAARKEAQLQEIRPLLTEFAEALRSFNPPTPARP